MDGHSTKTDENGFDDNGLQHAFMLASWQEIPSSECIDERYKDGTELSHCDATPTGRDEVKSTDIGDCERKPHGAAPFEDENGAISLGVHPEIVGVIRDDENKQLLIPKDPNDAKKGPELKDGLDLPVGHTTRKDGAEVADGRSTKRSRKVKAKDEKLGVHQEVVGVIRDEENQQPLIPKDNKDATKGTEQKDDSDLPVGDTIKKEKAENFDGTKSPGKVKEKRTKFRSGRSAKDGGSFKRITDLGLLSLLTSFWATICAKISWTFSVSLTVGILLLMPSVGVDSALTAAVPINTLVVVGTTVRMNCTTDLNQPVYWARTLAGSDEQQWLYYGNDGFHSNNADGRFSIDKDEAMGRYDVIIADIQLKDAGQYVCIDDSGLGTSASAELIVSDPIKCNSYIPSDGVMGYNVFGLKQDFIQVSCSLKYVGNLSPTLEWSWPGSDVQNDERDVYAAKSLVVSTLKLSPSKEHNGVKFQCKANIKGPTLQTIDSGLKWESETITVKYAEFAREEVDACPGVELNLICNPQCSYTFEKGKDDTCRCLYTYHGKKTQQNYQSASYAVNCANEKDNSLPVILIPVAVVIVILVATGIAVTVAVHLKKKMPKWFTCDAKSDQTRSNSDDSGRPMLAKV